MNPNVAEALNGGKNTHEGLAAPRRYFVQRMAIAISSKLRQARG